LSLWITLAVVMGFDAPVAATEEQTLIDRARLAVDALRDDSKFEAFPKLLGKAKAVLLFPELIKVGFILGGEGGSGVLLVRDAETARWSHPAFYTMGSGSIGLQIGAQVAEVAFVVMTDGGLAKLMSGKLTLGADASIAAGPVGAGVEAGTTLNVEADIYAFSHAKGAYGGVSFEGALIVQDDEANEAYYGKAVTTRGIVLHGEARNRDADALRAALGKK
jgi:lipid-binding SYLF domain-containing protein